MFTTRCVDHSSNAIESTDVDFVTSQMRGASPYQRTRCIQIAVMPLRAKLRTFITSHDKNENMCSYQRIQCIQIRAMPSRACVANNFSDLR
jgi:hypothetical protein